MSTSYEIINQVNVIKKCATKRKTSNLFLYFAATAGKSGSKL